MSPAARRRPRSSRPVPAWVYGTGSRADCERESGGISGIHAHRCLAALRPYMERSRAITTSRLAQAQLAQGDVDTATDTAMTVKAEAATQHPRVSRMLQEFGAALRAMAPGSSSAITWTEHTAAWRTHP